MCHEAGQSAFLHTQLYFYLRILIISYLATFLGTNSLSVLMCRKQSINQSLRSIPPLCIGVARNSDEGLRPGAAEAAEGVNERMYTLMNSLSIFLAVNLIAFNLFSTLQLMMFLKPFASAISHQSSNLYTGLK